VDVNSIALPDDTVNTYIRALKDNVRPDTSMVVMILPSNRKDRYDAIKVFCCVENPGTHCIAAVMCASAGDCLKRLVSQLQRLVVY